MPPKRQASGSAAATTGKKPSALAFAGGTRGVRIARGGIRRVRGHKPVALEYIQAREAEKATRGRGTRATAAVATTSGRRQNNDMALAVIGGRDGRDNEDKDGDEAARAVRLALEAAERGEDFGDDGSDGDGDGVKRKHRNKAHKGVGYIASKGRGRAIGGAPNTLGLLDLADEETVRELLGHLPVGHQNERAAIVKNLEKQYRRWFQLVRAGFSVLLYGFGSKKALMEDFEKRYCVDGGVIVVNGFFPSLTPKQVVVAAAAALSTSEKDDPSSTAASTLQGMGTESLLAHIQSATRGTAKVEPKRLYIILHNIDGPQLRTQEAQALLGELASMPRVHLIASIDHVNAPLLWSKREAARFNWVWQESSTFTPYALETANLPQLLASKGEERHVRGAANVLRSLTSNGRDIFRLLAEHQLENQDSQGMPLDMFYAACREQFLVSSEVTLRVHLTEFTDHELVRSKRGVDGRDLLVVPLNADALRALLKEFDP